MGAGNRFRFLFYKLLPSWLTNGDGEKILHVLHRVKDGSLEKLRGGMTQRFPSMAGDDALELIGKDRLIPRGRTEAKAHYVERLKRWRFPRGHRVRGNAYALLEQVSEYFGLLYVQSIDVKGNQFTRDVDGTQSAVHGLSWDWDADATSRPRRFWLTLWPQPEHPEIRAWGTWAEFAAVWGTWGAAKAAGATWGQQGVTRFDIVAIRRLLKPPAPWKPAGTRGEYAIIVLQDRTIPLLIDPSGQAWDTLAGRNTAHGVLRFWRLT